MEWITALIASTPEYQAWGYNLATASFVMTVALTFGLQLPGLISQARTIWKNRSADGVEMLTFIAFFTYFAVFCVYAFHTKSGAGMVNTGVLLMPQLFILAGIARFKPQKRLDILAAVAGVSLLLMAVLLPNTALYYTIASVVVFAGLALQPIEMMRTKTSANIALSFPLGFAFVCAVWTVYGVTIHDWYIAGASAAFMFEYLWTASLWFRYRASTAS